MAPRNNINKKQTKCCGRFAWRKSIDSAVHDQGLFLFFFFNMMFVLFHVTLDQKRNILKTVLRFLKKLTHQWSTYQHGCCYWVTKHNINPKICMQCASKLKNGEKTSGKNKQTKITLHVPWLILACWNIKESAQTLRMTEASLQKKKSWLMESAMLTLQVVKAQQLDAYIRSKNSSASRWKYISTRASKRTKTKTNKLTS